MDGDSSGEFGAGTEEAVRLFQHERGLRVDGVCGHQTWSALVEAGYRLGERLLYRRAPMLRGDDVADLQGRLGALGFDAGRIDGILGDITSRALADFQRNAGITVDAIFGRSTLDELVRLQPRSETARVVAAVRERELLRRSPRTLEGRRIALGEEGGLDATIAALTRSLKAAGAEVLDLHHPDGSHQAAEANHAQADVYLGIRLEADSARCTTAYYSGYRYESEGGRRLAELLQAMLPEAMGAADGGTLGMSLPVLRETRMPAVVCEIGPPSAVVERSTVLATTMSEILSKWADESWE
ncbi:MAG: peptidoglycan-binding protein [Acidimicrobiales bacterium]